MYNINVNATYSFDVSEDQLSEFDAIETGKDRHHILHDYASVKAQILKSNFNSKNYTVKINNNTYAVQIQDDLDQLIKKMGFSLSDTKKVDAIKAPMPGLILEVNVKPGQEVKENDALMILEAMKMENVINSPRDGVIKAIHVNETDSVIKNALLIEFE